MERYFSNKTRSPDRDNDTGTSRSRIRRRLSASNITTVSLPKPTIHTKINLDELPYDLADRKRISEYTRNSKKEDEIRRKYLTRDLIGHRLILITHRGRLEILNVELIRISLMNMVVGLA